LVEQHAKNFCSEYTKNSSSGSSFNLDASYKFLALSLGNADTSAATVASRYCSALNDGRIAEDVYKEYIQSIAPGAYPAYKQCLDSAQEIQFKIDSGCILPKEFSVIVTFIGHVTQHDAQLVYVSSKGVACRWTSEPQHGTRTMKMSSSAVLKCERDNQDVDSYVRIVRTDGTTGDLTIPWPPYSKDGIPVDTVRDLQNAIGKLQEKDNQLVNELGVIKTSVDGLQNRSTFKVLRRDNGPVDNCDKWCQREGNLKCWYSFIGSGRGDDQSVIPCAHSVTGYMSCFCFK
jgi:hypothetical protein